MKKISFYFTSLLLGAALIFTACDKDEATPQAAPAEESQAANDYNYVTTSLDDAINTAGEAMSVSNAGGRISAENEIPVCAQLTHDIFTKTVTIDFGTTGCTAPGGRTRTGKIKINYVGRYREPGSTAIITFNNYTVEGNSLNGTISLTGMQLNSSNQLEYTVKIENGQATFADGTTYRLDLIRTQTWVAGSNTLPMLSDDEYSTAYAGSVTTRKGTTYAVATSSPLLLKGSCLMEGYFYPVSGTVAFQSTVGPAWQLDFGTGTCDKVATLTYATKTYTLSLR